MNKATLTPEENSALENVFSSALTVAIDRMDLRKSCLSCANFLEGADICNLVGRTPPARTIVQGCEAYETNEPF